MRLQVEQQMAFFFQLLALAAGSLVVCYGVGATLRRLLRTLPEEWVFECFLRLFIGVVGLTAGYAIFRARGNTILLPVFFLLLGIVYSLRQPRAGGHTAPAAGISWRTAALLLGTGSVVFLGQYLLLYEPGTPFLQFPYQDYVYYSRLTLPLNKMGLETKSLEAIFPQFQAVQPYHYFDLWLNALLVQLTGLPSVWVLIVSAATVLMAICGVGFAALFTHCGLRLRWAMVLGLLMLTVMGTVWPPLLRYPLVLNGAWLSHMLLALHPKLAPVYLFELLAALLLLRRRFQAAGLAIAALPLVSIATAPAAGVGAVGLALYLGLRRALPIRRILALAAPTVAVLAYAVGFYALQPEPYQFPATGRSFMLASMVPSAGQLRTLLNIGIGAVAMYAVFFAGHGAVVALLALRRRSLGLQPPDWPLVAWFVASFAGALLMSTVGHRFADGFQLFSNPMVPLTAIVLAVFLGRVLQGMPFWGPFGASTAFSLLLLMGLWPDTAGFSQLPGKNSRFSAQFMRQVGPVLQSLPNRGGFLLADADYINVYRISGDSYTAGTYVSAFKNDYLLLSLSAFVPDSFATDPRFARDSSLAEQLRRSTTLYRLSRLRSLARRPLPVDSLPVALVRQAGLAFICASPQAVLPSALRPLVKAQYRDTYSGERLYVLKPEAISWHAAPRGKPPKDSYLAAPQAPLTAPHP